MLRGDLDMASAPGVLAEIDQLVAEGVPGRVVLDLGRVDFLDSSGLAVLASVLTTGRSIGFEVALAHLGTRHRHLLDIVRMSELFATE